MEKILDATGLFCPEPVFRTKMAMEGMRDGDTLVLKADDPAADEDVSRWARRNGHAVTDKSEADGIVTLHIRK